MRTTTTGGEASGGVAHALREREAHEACEVAAVGLERARREPALERRVLQEGVHRRVEREAHGASPAAAASSASRSFAISSGPVTRFWSALFFT